MRKDQLLKAGDLREISTLSGTHKAQITVECTEHQNNPCVCTDPVSSYPIRDLSPTKNVPWLACDYCKGWYHRQCLKYDDPKVKAKGDYDVFECKYCRDWKQKKLKG